MHQKYFKFFFAFMSNFAQKKKADQDFGQVVWDPSILVCTAPTVCWGGGDEDASKILDGGDAIVAHPYLTSQMRF